MITGISDRILEDDLTKRLHPSSTTLRGCTVSRAAKPRRNPWQGLRVVRATAQLTGQQWTTARSKRVAANRCPCKDGCSRESAADDRQVILDACRNNPFVFRSFHRDNTKGVWRASCDGPRQPTGTSSSAMRFGARFGRRGDATTARAKMDRLHTARTAQGDPVSRAVRDRGGNDSRRVSLPPACALRSTRRARPVGVVSRCRDF